jgi:cellulose synthase/poly-beta-1,6-N-acetylglucosamine synthase-like glycosyltransferase
MLGMRMRKLAIIVPVSPFEPQDLVLNSAKHILSLDHTGFNRRIVYVIDVKDSNPIVAKLKRMGIDVLERNDTRGRRAGALNDALAHLKNFKPEYVAIFDVDSKPEKNFIEVCVSALEKDRRAYIASSRRYISNAANIVSQTIEAEYYLINFLLKKSSFKQFNGLIGVLRADLLYRHTLNEDIITEDADFATRMHSMGYKAILVDETCLHEQSPLSWRDVLNQRKRWYYGGLQLWKYWKDIRKSTNKKFILSWVMALTLTYCVAIILPLLILAPLFLLYKFRKLKKILVAAGLVVHILLLQYAALFALWMFMRKRSIEWKSMRRVIE